MKRYSIIALDIGNTCVQLHPERVHAALEGADLPGDLFVSNYDAPFVDFLTGRSTAAEFTAWLAEKCCNRLTPEEVRVALVSLIGSAIPGMPDLMRELHERGAKIHYFSDINEIHRNAFEVNTAGLYDFVESGIFSNEVQLIKPDTRMFEAFEQRFGYPDLYIDDRADLCQAAKAHGWNAVHFNGNTAELRELL